LVDSSVWIDFLHGTNNAQTERLSRWLDAAQADIGVADLVVFEVLRGFRHAQDYARARRLLLALDVVEIGGLANALAAAEHYRELRAVGHDHPQPHRRAARKLLHHAWPLAAAPRRRLRRARNLARAARVAALNL